jgi:hypothetical protein
MKVRMLIDTIISFGPQRVTRGQEIELPDGMAQSFLRAGVAEPVAAPIPPAAEPPTAETEDKALRPKRQAKGKK